MKSLLNGIILLFVVFHATKACGDPNEVHERLKELKRDAESDEWRNLVRKSYVAATKELVVNEYNEIWKDIEKMLGVRHSSGGFSGGITGRMFSGQSYTYGGFKIHAGFDKGYIDIEIVDEEICEEIDAALRKRGRALPKLP